MSWDLVTLGEAIADTLDDDTVPVFAAPPTSLNPPALVVSYPELVEIGTVALGIDEVTVAVVAVVNFADSAAAMGELIAAVRLAIAGDRKLGGAVAQARLAQVRSVRAEKVSGIDVLTAELVLTVEM